MFTVRDTLFLSPEITTKIKAIQPAKEILGYGNAIIISADYDQFREVYYFASTLRDIIFNLYLHRPEVFYFFIDEFKEKAKRIIKNGLYMVSRLKRRA
jgi:hypothetical protein